MNLRGMKLVLMWLVGVIAASAATPEEIVADPQLWPTEVTVTAVAKGTVINNGKDGGMMLIGAGTRLVVTGVTATGVIGKSGLTSVRVPVEKTDLLQRAGSPAAVAPMAEPAAAVASTAATATPSGAPSLMQRKLAGKLMRMQNGKLQKADDSSLAGVKYYALYYSASWCGPCREFTPKLLASYNKMKAKYPQFEVIFVSRDHSAGAMRDYMKDDGMTWLAVKYDEAKDDGSYLASFRKGTGIPCLVLVDSKGKVISDTYEDGNYLGPQKVLADTTKLLNKGE
ncbi:thioredoxin-like domain-containing protein [Oleiharenicola lentus]|uniref:thioredoxin-like domain-containing protein n=1 Tax=Oleiharenicola lentus TaxID=2508720 RepID=UPI003F6664B3